MFIQHLVRFIGVSSHISAVLLMLLSQPDDG